MQEDVGAIGRFADDLFAVGTPEQCVIEAVRRYVDALFEPSDETWARLYRYVSQTLEQWRSESIEPTAAQRLFAFIDDDFGREVLELPVRAHLCEMLLHHRMHENSGRP
jgi:hypothetical protein